MLEGSQWQIQPIVDVPDWFVRAVSKHAGGLPGRYAAQLLWWRGIRDLEQLDGFLDSTLYKPTGASEFGQEIYWAVERLHWAQQNAEKVAIWGDFDADGITATAVLWEGLGQFFPQQQLTYFIPNRLTESHGLSRQGIDALAAQGYRLIVTCDTGSTSLSEIAYADRLGIDLIITDHHTLPTERPAVKAILNPRSLPRSHALANLSGVAVAYKLVEALYETLSPLFQRPLEDLLDLVAIGLIADLVELTGDCRYLAQRGIKKLQQNQGLDQAPRPGVARLLELCKRNGDRPTDISFGLGPRINAISRIHGDARFCVELLTSQDKERCCQLAEETELANTRRKALQKEVAQQVKNRLAQLDLSTTRAIVLADPQWSVGILGLVAGQIAQEYGRPTILLSLESEAIATGRLKTDEATNGLTDELIKRTDHTASSSTSSAADRLSIPVAMPLARGSARSVNQIDLYQLVKTQTHLLHSFGGHPFAMGLSLSAENIPLFAEAINRQLREQQIGSDASSSTMLRADLRVTVAELGKDLFRELKLLEPCGIGNPAPKLLLQNCWFSSIWNRNIQDWRGGKVRYIKTEFEIWDDSTKAGFSGVWWDHYKDQLPLGRCDAIAELDFNSFKKRYEIRLIAVRAAGTASQIPAAALDWILDWRDRDLNQPKEATEAVLSVASCPSSWDELQRWVRRAAQTGQKLAIAYPPPSADSAIEIWQRFVGIAKFLSRTGNKATRNQLYEKLGIGDRALQIGFRSLKLLGFEVTSSAQGFQMSWQVSEQSVQPVTTDLEIEQAIAQFLTMVREEQFHRLYFYKVPLATIQAVADQTITKHYDLGEISGEISGGSLGEKF